MFEHKTVSLADQVFENLEKDILSGRYNRGDILTESRLSAELGVSRTPIREALRRLEQEHLLEETAKGCMVIGLSEEDIRDIFDIRMQLEGLAARRAASLRTDAQLNQLKECLELQEFYCSKSDAEQIKQQDNMFHETIFRLSGSMTFYDTLIPLHKKVQKYRRVSVENRSRAVDSVAEHRKVFEAIASGDGDAAQRAMTEHIRHAAAHILPEKEA